MVRSAVALFERFFALAIVLAAGAGLVYPDVFIWADPYKPMLLGWVMFSIGLTIRLEHLKDLARRPAAALFAMGKFVFMPWIAYAVARLLLLPPEAVIGMVILGACPGGVSANVMSYLARANTALTVLMTIFTTLLAPVVTPAIVYMFFQHQVPMDVSGMMQKLFWIVVFPIADALLLRRFLARFIHKVEWVFPPLSMVLVALIIGCVAATNRERLLDDPWLVVVGVLIFNLGGYAFGYMLAKIAHCDRKTCQAVAFEYGIQDSSLGIIVASFFSSFAALPSASCSLIQNITGPWLAKLFAEKSAKEEI